MARRSAEGDKSRRKTDSAMVERKLYDLDDDASISSKSTVSFGSVQVREYERVIDTSKYMGLSLGWAYLDKPPSTIDDREDSENSERSRNNASQKKKSEAEKVHKMHNGERFEVFLTYGFTRKQLKDATTEAAKIISQQQKEAARQLVLAEKAKKSSGQPPKRKLLRSLF